MVDFFFVLSGFVLTRAFWTESRSQNFGLNIWGRVARMYPLHFVTLCLAGGLQLLLVDHWGAAPFVYTHNDSYHFALNALLLNASGLESGFSFNAPSWSISTEFLVNVVFLALITAPKRTSMVLMTAIAAAAMGTLCYRGVINGTRAFSWLSNDVVRTAAGFFAGVFSERVYARWLTTKSSIFYDLGAIAVIIWTMIYLASQSLWCIAGDVSLCLLAFPALLLSVMLSRFVKRILQLRPLVYLGVISYSIYLVHFPLQLAFHIAQVSSLVSPNYASDWVFIAFIAAVVALASVTYRYIEMPSEQWLSNLAKPASLEPAELDLPN